MVESTFLYLVRADHLALHSLQVIAFGACFPIVSYAIQASAPPFPVLCLSYVISGIGLGFQVSFRCLHVKDERVKLIFPSTFKGCSKSSFHRTIAQHVGRLFIHLSKASLLNAHY